MKKKTFRILLTILSALLITGCLCNTKNGAETSGLNETGKEHRLICEKPYITAGASCCLDQDDNKICDTEEPAEATTVETTTLQATTSATSTLTASTTITNMPPQNKTMVESCANKYDVTSDTILYIYTESCCDPVVTSHVKAVKNSGYKFEYIKLNEVTIPSREDSLLKCFFPHLDTVPWFVCSANGKRMMVTSKDPIRTKIREFAENCTENAYK